MTVLKKYDFQAKEIGSDEIEDTFLDVKVSDETIKRSIIAICKNKMQRSANTKDKSEVKATGKKPHAQKGLGRARQGSLVSPQFRGGGVVFGPKPGKVLIKLNKKQKHLAIKAIIAKKIKDNKTIILEEFLKEPKTKIAFNFFNTLGMIDKRVLVLGSKEDNFLNTKRSISNLPKKHFKLWENINSFDLARCLHIIFLGSCFSKVKEFFEKKIVTRKKNEAAKKKDIENE